MLEIQNIEKIKGDVLSGGRVVIDTGDFKDGLRRATELYQFVINECEDGEDFNKQQTIVLERKPGNKYDKNNPKTKDKYEMFTMGLQMSTSTYLTKSDIKDPNVIRAYLQVVMDKTEQFYDNNN